MTGGWIVADYRRDANTQADGHNADWRDEITSQRDADAHRIPDTDPGDQACGRCGYDHVGRCRP